MRLLGGHEHVVNVVAAPLDVERLIGCRIVIEQVAAPGGRRPWVPQGRDHTPHDHQPVVLGGREPRYRLLHR